MEGKVYIQYISHLPLWVTSAVIYLLPITYAFSPVLLPPPPSCPPPQLFLLPPPSNPIYHPPLHLNSLYVSSFNLCPSLLPRCPILSAWPAPGLWPHGQHLAYGNQTVLNHQLGPQLHRDSFNGRRYLKFKAGVIPEPGIYRRCCMISRLVEVSAWSLFGFQYG